VIVYGVLAEEKGRPVAVEVYRGNTGDSTTVGGQVMKLQERFGLQRVVLVGDRGVLTETQIEHLRAHPGLGWISAPKSKAIQALVAEGALQASLFDERNLALIRSPDYPGERLIACYNPLLAEDRRRTRGELVAATERALEGIQRQVARRTKKPLTEAQIGVKVGKVLNAYKVGKHFEIDIKAGHFEWSKRWERIEQEQDLDGIYVIRTSEPAKRLSAAQAVRQYKNLCRVEQIFRTLKGLDVRIRPIRHRAEEHVRGHIFMCTLAYYVEWHMRRALAPLLFEDEEIGCDPSLLVTRGPSTN